jgi:tRNA-splicing ligase RtcB
VEHDWGTAADLERIEEHGQIAQAEPDHVSDDARHRQSQEMGTLGDGNHYLEVQEVAAIHDTRAARAYGLKRGDIVVALHCGSRHLSYQMGIDYLRLMAQAAASGRRRAVDPGLACAPLKSELAQRYLGAMRAAANCALANRQIITHRVRQVFSELIPKAQMPLLYDVSHNTCREEEHWVEGHLRRLFVHRRGATRALGPGHLDIPEPLRQTGQPVLLGGALGESSYVLAGMRQDGAPAFSSACHGAGRALSRHPALKHARGRHAIEALAARGIIVRGLFGRNLVEEAPGDYKDVRAVVDAAERAGLARKVARLEPLICVKS